MINIKKNVKLFFTFILIIYNIFLFSQSSTNNFIYLHVFNGLNIKLSFLGASENSYFIIYNGNDTLSDDIVIDKWESIEFITKDSIIRISGNYKGFACNNNKNIIISLITDNQDLNYLYCFENSLSLIKLNNCISLKEFSCFSNNLFQININNCKSLNYIDCDGNFISSCGLDSIFHQLPNKNNSNEFGYIYIKNDTASNPGVNFCRDTIATNKNWKVQDYNKNNPINISNTIYECPYFNLYLNEYNLNNIIYNIYPNPSHDEITIKCNEEIYSIEIFDILGKNIFTSEKNIYEFILPIQSLSKGFYILKLTTKTSIFFTRICKI